MEKQSDGSVLLTKQEWDNLATSFQAMLEALDSMSSSLSDFVGTRRSRHIYKWDEIFDERKRSTRGV